MWCRWPHRATTVPARLRHVAWGASPKAADNPVASVNHCGCLCMSTPCYHSTAAEAPAAMLQPVCQLATHTVRQLARALGGGRPLPAPESAQQLSLPCTSHRHWPCNGTVMPRLGSSRGGGGLRLNPPAPAEAAGGPSSRAARRLLRPSSVPRPLCTLFSVFGPRGRERVRPRARW